MAKIFLNVIKFGWKYSDIAEWSFIEGGKYQKVLLREMDSATIREYVWEIHNFSNKHMNIL